MRLYLLLFLVFTIACKESSNQEVATTNNKNMPMDAKKKSAPADNGLNQNGDYSSLFNRSDCNVISESEISATLGLDFKNVSTKNSCAYRTQLSGKDWQINITKFEKSKKGMLKEINNFKNHSAGFLKHSLSDSGDTHFCLQHSHGYLTMYNLNYESAILIRYGSVGESLGFTKEDRLEQQGLALKLANALLRNHKK